MSDHRCVECCEPMNPSAVRCPHCAVRQPSDLHRDGPGRLVGGVCSALARHFGWDQTLMRVLFIASLAVTGGLVFWVYVALWVLLPFEPQGRSLAVRAMDSVGNLFRQGGAPLPDPPNDAQR